MDCSTPGLLVHNQLPEFTQTQVHWVGDAIQPSHPLLSPSPPALNLSQHHGLFKWVSSSHQVAKGTSLQLVNTELFLLTSACPSLSCQTKEGRGSSASNKQTSWLKYLGAVTLKLCLVIFYKHKTFLKFRCSVEMFDLFLRFYLFTLWSVKT